MARILEKCPFLFYVPFLFLLDRAVGVSGRIQFVRSFQLNEYDRRLDWQASGIRVGSDGNCYFACSSHAPDRGCAFFRYDPRADELKVLCEDITIICGENPSRTPPQGKIRSDIVEADGWLYFGTHLANYWCEAEKAYTGGHLVAYELATGRFRDYGVVHSNYTILSGVAVDPARGYLYAYVTPYPDGEGTHLYRIELGTGAKEDLGLLHPGMGISHFLFVDWSGDCWFASTGAGGTIFRARGTNGEIDRFKGLLPPTYSWQNANDMEADHSRSIEWAQPLPDRHQCLFTMQTGNEVSGDTVWLLDTSKEIGDAIRPMKHIGLTGLGLAVDKTRVYYVQHNYAKPFKRASSKLVQRTIAKVLSQTTAHSIHPELHLRSMKLDTCSITDHGLIVDQYGRKPSRIDSVTTDGNGTVFMTGDWQLLPWEKGSLLYNHKKKCYDELHTAEFFAVTRPEDTRS